MTAPKHRAPLTGDDLAAMLAARDADRARTLDALRKLGEASCGELAAGIGITDTYERKKLRACLVAWEGKYVRRRFEGPIGGRARTVVWSVAT